MTQKRIIIALILFLYLLLFPVAALADPVLPGLLAISGIGDNYSPPIGHHILTFKVPVAKIVENNSPKGAPVSIREEQAYEVFFNTYNKKTTVKEDLNKKLYEAVANNNLKLTKELISKGADVNSRDNAGYTILMFACEKGKTEIAKLLIAKGADVNAKVTGEMSDMLNYKGYTALMFATDNGYTETAKLLIAKGADVNAKNSNGLTALISAIWNEKKDTAKLLIGKGADVNYKSSDGWTALMQASTKGNTEIAKLLIGKGADVNYNNGSTALMETIADGHTETAKLLIANGANINSRDNAGYTPLLLASQSGRIEIVKLLITKGADINAKFPLSKFNEFKAYKGWTAMMFASANGFNDIVGILKKAGAKE